MTSFARGLGQLPSRNHLRATVWAGLTISVIAGMLLAGIGGSTPIVQSASPVSSVEASGGVLVFTGTGEANNLTVSLTSGSYTLSDTAATLTPGTGCGAVNANEVSCPATGITSISILGLEGNDTLKSIAATPATIDGGGGNDFLIGGTETDSLNGGEGTDTLDYSSAPSAVTVNLATTTGQNTGGAGTDTISNVENLVGSAHSDTLTGSSANNVIEGKAGNDAIAGAGGTDGVKYTTATAGVKVNLSLTTAQDTIGAGTDTIAQMENAIGSAHADALIGDAGANVLVGGDGNDAFNGNAGDDAVDGGAGTDTLDYSSAPSAVTVNLATTSAQNTGGAGTDTVSNAENLVGSDHSDTLTGSSANNVIEGKAGNDAISGAGGTDGVKYTTSTAGVKVNLSLTTAQDTIGAGTDTITQMENVIGSAHADTLIGDAGANVLVGGDGNDAFNGNAGDDAVDGGAGTDTLDYSSALSAVTVNLATTTAQNTGGAGTDTITNAENLIGSAYNDTLAGNSANNVIEGKAGNDAVSGAGGTDGVKYTSATAGVDVNLSLTTAQDTIGAGTDTITQMENVIGSAHADTLIGEAGANVLVGGDGDDTITPGAGVDVVDAGAGSDTLTIRDLTADTANCGLGADTATADPADSAGLTACESVTLPSAAQITSGPAQDAYIPTNTPEFAFTAPVGATFECNVDAGALAPCTSPEMTESLSEGEHTFGVKGIDSTGDVDQTLVTRTFTVDTMPPDLWWDERPTQFDPSDPKVFKIHSGDAAAPVELECALDEEEFTPCSSPVELSGLSVGEHQMTVRATDEAGNSSQIVSGQFMAFDPTNVIEFSPAQPPVMSPASTPISISSSIPVPRISCEIVFTVAGNPSPPQYYSECPESYVPGPWDPSAEVTITATAWDSGGLQVGDPNSVEFVFDADAPQVAITDKPDPDEPFESPSREVTFESSATDLDRFECSVNGESPFECTSPWSAENLPVCVSTLTVYAVDSVGNRAQDEATYWRRLDPTQVDTRLGCATPQMGGGWGEEEPGMSSFSAFGYYPSGPNLLTSALVDGVIDPLGATFVCKLDDRSWERCFGASDVKNAISNPGPHTLQVATEFDGERDPNPASVSWISTQPAAEPNATFRQTPPSESADATPTVRFDSGTPGATFDCRLDGQAWSECASPLTITANSGETLAVGSHVFEVRARTAGATQSEPISTIFVVTEALPAPIITSGPENGDLVSGAISFAFIASSASPSFVCSIDGIGYAPCQSPITLPASSVERRTFSVRSVAFDGGYGSAANRYIHTDGASPATEATSPVITMGPAESSTLADGRVRFAFDSSQSDVSFVCKIDDGQFTPCESPVSYVLADGAHDFEVGAVGASATASRSFAVVSDYPAFPYVKIHSDPGYDGSRLNSLGEFGAPEFTFTAEIENVDFECQIDGGEWTACDSPYRASLGEIYGTYANHEFAVRIVRVGGDGYPDAQIIFNPADYTTAQIPISIFPAVNADGDPEWKTLTDGIVVSSSSIQVAAHEYAYTHYGAEGPSDYALKCTVDEQPWELCGSVFTSEGLTNGTHRIGIRSPDAPGHRGYTEYRDFVVDDPNAPNPNLPVPSITAGPEDEAIQTDIADFVFSVPTGYSAQCRLDDDSFSACESPYSTPPLLEDDHVFEIRAVSASGAVGVAASRSFSSPDTELTSDYGEVVDYDGVNDRVTDQALDRIKKQVIDGLNAPNEASGAASASQGSSASNFAEPTVAVDKHTIVGFLKAVGAWPTEEEFMTTIGVIGAGEPMQVRIDFHATFPDDEDADDPSQHAALATQDFNGMSGANHTIQLNGVNYRKYLTSWHYKNTNLASNAPLSEPRMYAYGIDVGYVGESCDILLLSCFGGAGFSWLGFKGRPGFVCVPADELGQPTGNHPYWASGFPDPFGSSGTIDTVPEGSPSRCQETNGEGGSVSIETERHYQRMGMAEAYNTFSQELRYENCISGGGDCRSITISLDDIDPRRAAEKCVYPQFEAICQVYGNKVKLDGFGKSELPVGDPVNPATGNFELTKTDLAATGKGGELTLARTYNSTDKRTGALGRGWSWAGTEGLAILNNLDARVAQIDGKTFDFDRQSDGSYDAPYGHDETLVRNGDGTYIFTAPYGDETTRFDDSGQILSKTDKSGNQVVYHREGTRLDALIGSANQRIDFAYTSGGMLASATDSNGREVKFTFDDSLLTEVKNPELETVTYEYNSRKHLTVANQPDDTVGIVNTYDRRGRVLTQIVGEDPQATFEYDTRSTKYTDPAGHTQLVRSDRFGRPTSQTSSRTGRTVFHRDARGRVTSMVRADGKRTTFEYDSQGRLIDEIDPAGNVTHTDYDAASNVELTRDALGRETTYTYDENNDLETSTDPMGFTTEYNWLEPGLLESSTDPLGYTTEYEYDGSGRVERVIDPLGGETSVTYDEHGYLESATDALGRETTYEHSEMGNLEATTDPEGATTTNEYDELGNLVETTDPLGNVTTTEFSAPGRPSQTSVEGQVTSKTGYDALGRAAWTSDGRGATTSYAYGTDGNLARVVSPERSTSSYRYDLLGRRTAETDARGHTTRYEYDVVGNVTKVTDASGAATSYEYDAVGNLTKEVNALGHVTTYQYDDNDRLEREVKPLGLVTDYVYDEAGRLESKSVAGETTSFIRDLVGRTTRILLADGSDQHFEYNLAGELKKATGTNDQTVDFTYDDAGRVETTKDALGAITTFTYDDSGDAISMVDPSGTTTIDYDAQHRPIRIDTPGGRSHRFTYDGGGNLIESAVYKPDGAGSFKLIKTTKRFYDLDGRLTSSYTRNPQGKLLASLAYTYDEAGNPTKRKTDASEQHYEYDALNRLTQVQFANHADTYTYDQVGNRATKNGALYTYNDRGELTAAPGGKTYAYDPQGRRTAKTTPSGTETYAWNSLDQLTARTTPDAKTYAYAFDALGRMTSAAEGGFTRTYNYGASDSPTSIQSALTGAAGSQLRREEFSYGPGGLLETRVNDQAPSYPVTDRLGTLTGEVSDRGEVSAAPELDPFGVPVAQLPAPPQIDQQTLGFLGGAGRESLPDSGLVKMGARMYDAETGAFVTRDPVTGEPSEPARRVAYAYAFGGPGRFVDLDGLSPLDFVKKVVENQTIVYRAARDVVADLAADQTRAAQRTLDDPFASPLAKELARVSKLLSSTVDCADDVDSAVLFFFTRGRGRGGKVGTDFAYHYTRKEVARLIEKNGLRPGSYVTKNGSLSPLQAQIDLALPPNRGLPGATIRVDLAGLRRAGYDVGDFVKVGRKHNMPGGGSELQLQKAIPPQFVKVVH